LRSGFRFKARLDLRHPALRRTALLALPLLLYVATNLVGVTFRNRFALQVALPGLQPDAGQAIVTYAWVFYQLPYGIFAVALATAFFPELSAAAHQADWKKYADQFTRGLRTTALLILPCAALLVALAYPIVKVYQFGSFKAAAVAPTAQVLSVWALGLFSFAAFMFILRSFYSMQDTRTPMLLNIFATALQVLMYWAFTQGVAGWGGLGLAGIPASDVVTYTLLSIALLVVLRLRIGPMDLSKTSRSIGRSLIVALGAGVSAWAAVALTPGLGASRWGFLLQDVVGASVGLAVAAGLAVALRIPEVETAKRLISRVVGRLLPGRG
jgi:putative peptidoglycan lipid II flippase